MGTITLLWLGFTAVLVLLAAADVRPWLRLGCGFLAVFSLWLFWGMHGAAQLLEYWVQKGRTSNDLSGLGQVGDLFGGINALFAALAFAGVAVASYFQYTTLKLTRQQHAQQSFEPLFFKLIELHRQVAESVKLDIPESMRPDELRSSASNAFATPIAVDALRAKVSRNCWKSLKGLEGDAKREARDDLMTKHYLAFYAINQNQLGPYFRSLYHVFKLIKNASGIDDDQRDEYASIARSSIGEAELFLLALNCLTVLGRDFRPLVERFGLLRHVQEMRDRESFDKAIARICYHPTASMSTEERREHWKTPNTVAGGRDTVPSATH